MAKRICTACGHVGHPITATKGRLGVEVFLWLLFLLPGLIYSLWRIGSRHAACAACGGTSLVPLDSPMGRRLVDDLHPERDFRSAPRRFGDAVVDYLNRTP